MHIVYIGISFLEYFKSLILSKNDSHIAQVISQICLDDAQDVAKIISKSKQLKANMPISIHMKLESYKIFEIDHIDSVIEDLNRQFCLTVLPEEILVRAYPEGKICDCTAMSCDWCTKRQLSPLIVIDLRTEEEHNKGVLPNSMLLNPLAYDNTEEMLNYPDQFIEMRGIVHICLLGSKEFKASNYELEEANLEEEQDIVQNMTENLLQAFLMKGFPYISLIDGGYWRCHNLAIQKGLDIENHDPNGCRICRREKEGDSPLSYIKRRVISKVKQVFQIRDYNYGLVKDSEGAIFQCRIFNSEDFSIFDDKISLIITNKTIQFITNEEEDIFTSPILIIEFNIDKIRKIRVSKHVKSLIKIYFLDNKNAFCFITNSSEEAKQCVELISKQTKSRHEENSYQSLSVL